MATLDLFKDFATNTAAEEDGIWVDYADGVAFRIARANNKAYSKRLTKAYDRNKRILDTKGATAEAKSEEIMIDVIANTVLLGWRGDFLWNGAKLEYSVDNAKTLLAVKDFRAWVMQAAADFERFKLEQAEADSEK